MQAEQERVLASAGQGDRRLLEESRLNAIQTRIYSMASERDSGDLTVELYAKGLVVAIAMDKALAMELHRQGVRNEVLKAVVGRVKDA